MMIPLREFRQLCWPGDAADEPLVVDPTQAFVLLELSSDNRSTDAVIFLHIQALVEQACLMGADTDIPRKELERDVVVVETSVPYSTFHVQGVRVIQEARCYMFHGDDKPVSFRMPISGFSRRGCSALRDADGETVGAAWRSGG